MTHSFTPKVKAAQTKVLKNIQDIEARKRKFLEYTVNFYNLTNRRFDDREGVCKYNACETSPGCAIGRWPEKGSGFPFHMKGYIERESISSKLPAWMKEMGIDFLQSVQHLHDDESNWDSKGLSEQGVNYCVNKFGYDPR